MTYNILPWLKPALTGLLEQRNQLPHALLIRGPEGIGKLAFAQALAQALLCERPDAQGAACGGCSGCTWFGQGGHPDFRGLEPAEPAETTDAGEGRPKKASLQISVAQVRELQNFIFLTTHRGGARVVLIHPAEALNVNAANALLKNLEEPPARTCFLLVSHRWHQLLPTIRSRCRQVVLCLPAPEAALDWLRSREIREPALALAHAGGAPLLAAQLDAEYWELRERVLAALARPRFDALAAAEELQDAAPPQVVALLQKWSFDIVLHGATGTVRYNPDRAQAIAQVARPLDRLAALRFHRQMVQWQRVVHHPLNARLFLEELLLSYADMLRAAPARQAA